MNDGAGIWVDFNSELWLYIPMALPEGYKSPKKWAWDKAVAIAKSHNLSNEHTMRLCKYIENLAECSNEFEHRFVLLEDLEDEYLNVTVMFDLNDGERSITSIMGNEDGDEYLVPFSTKNLGEGLKALTLHVKKRVFKGDDSKYQLRFGFISGSLDVMAHATHPRRDYLIEHESRVDSLIRSVIPVN